MYVVVKFILEKTVEIVPTNWLMYNDTLSVWPPEKTLDIAGLVKKRSEPLPLLWEMFAIKILSRAATYEEARRKLIKATMVSDSDMPLSSDNDDYGRGKRKLCPKTYDFEEEESQDLLANLSAQPSKKLKQVNAAQRSTFSLLPTVPERMVAAHESTAEPEYTEDFLDSILSSPPAVERGATKRKVFKELEPIIQPTNVSVKRSKGMMAADLDNFQEHQNCAENHPPAGEINNRTVSQESFSSCPHFKMLENIHKELFYIREEQTRQGRMIDNIRERQKSEPAASESNVPRPHNDTNFPLNSVEEVENFEDNLKDVEIQRHFVTKFKRFGGNMFQDHARRIMKFLFSDSVAEHYNWQGGKGKRKFCGLKLCNVIIDAVEKENAPVTRSQVEEVIKNWLRHAKERKNYVKKSVAVK